MSWWGRRAAVREPAVAGRFYAGDAAGLAASVDAQVLTARRALGLAPSGQGDASRALADLSSGHAGWAVARSPTPQPLSDAGVAQVVAELPSLRAVVVPHAGHVYSGPIAGFGFATLGAAAHDHRVSRVVMLGPAHFVPVHGIGWSTATTWRTPLGDVPVAAELSEELTTGLPHAGAADRAHQPEHSLEVQLPFLQRVLGDDFAICPFLVGADVPDEVATLIRRASAHADVVVLVSTDLSHYLEEAAARAQDDRTIGAVLARDPQGIGERDACGRLPLRGLLTAARELGWEARLLDARTSADTAGDPDRVVGYASFVMTGERVSPDVASAEASAGETAGGGRGGPSDGPLGAGDRRATDPPAKGGSDADSPRPTSLSGVDDGLGPADQGRLLALARDTIKGAVVTRHRPPYDGSGLSHVLRAPGAAFVTVRSGSGELLGCIGSLSPSRELAADVVGHAFDAAFRDPRFPPLTPAQAQDMHLSISVLESPRPFPASGFDDLVARVPHESGVTVIAPGHRATFLPVVWEEMPGAAAFLAALWRKAGLPAGAWPRGIRIEVYSAQEFDED